jgi:hypothetical protein
MLIGRRELGVGTKVDPHAGIEDCLTIQRLLDELGSIDIVENNDNTAE